MQIRLLNKLRKQTLRERVYEDIVRLIVSNELPCDGLIREKQLIERLRISRTPFREAIGTLAKEGLVEIKPYCGFHVRSFSRKDADDLCEVYKQLACFAVKLAVPRMTDARIGELEGMLVEAAAALQSGDMTSFSANDREFQATIAEQSGNGALIETLARLSLQIQLCGAGAKGNLELAQCAMNRRDDMLQAFKARDVPRAALLMGAYIDHMQLGIRKCLSNEAAVTFDAPEKQAAGNRAGGSH
jgi:DNA-binding GntR family transcriptional regulator